MPTITQDQSTTNDPRWGQAGRDCKAEAIRNALQMHYGRSLDSGLWLDVGCGSGGIANALAPHVSRMVGVDPEPWARWQSFSRTYSNLDFHVGSYRQMVELIGEEMADVVICNQVYEHVDDPLALLQVIYKVMKPGAVCYFAGPNLIWPIEPHVFWPFVHWLPRHFAQSCMRRLGSRRGDELDAWLCSHGRLVRYFKEVGFGVSNGIYERVVVEAEMSHHILFKMAAKVPRMIMNALTPIAPGFVFMLRKHSIDDRYI